jgi:hypothetical protein
VLSRVFEALKAKFGDDVIFVGPDRVGDTSRPPRISWDPTGARLLPPNRAGGGPRDDGDIARRQWAIQVEAWGKDLDATEQLVDQLRAGAHDLATHFSFPSEGTETWDTGKMGDKGVTCTLQLFVIAPVRRTPKPVVKPEIVVTLKMNDTPI